MCNIRDTTSLRIIRTCGGQTFHIDNSVYKIMKIFTSTLIKKCSAQFDLTMEIFTNLFLFLFCFNFKINIEGLTNTFFIFHPFFVYIFFFCYFYYLLVLLYVTKIFNFFVFRHLVFRTRAKLEQRLLIWFRKKKQ